MWDTTCKHSLVAKCIWKNTRNHEFCEFSHLLLVLCFGLIFIINYFLAKITMKKIDLNSPKHETFQYLKRKALALFKTKPIIVEPNRATIEYNYAVSIGILCFYSCARQQTHVATNTAIAAPIMTRWF